MIDKVVFHQRVVEWVRIDVFVCLVFFLNWTAGCNLRSFFKQVRCKDNSTTKPHIPRFRRFKSLRQSVSSAGEDYNWCSFELGS